MRYLIIITLDLNYLLNVMLFKSVDNCNFKAFLNPVDNWFLGTHFINF